MGDFDRNSATPSAKANETKKVVFVIALGVVLIGLVAIQLLKRGDGPQSAAGAPVTSGVALPPPVLSEEISPQALAAMMAQLQNDPTSPLLRTELHAGRSADPAPRNPFAISDDWVKRLTRPGPVPVVATAQVAPKPPAPTPTVAQPLAPRADDFKLSSIVNGTMAIINGKVVKVGDIVGKARVVQIRDDAVLLQAADASDGPMTEISTSPRLNKDN